MDAAYLKVLGALVSGERLTLAEIKTRCDLDGYTTASLIVVLMRRGMILPMDGKYSITKSGIHTFQNETTPVFGNEEPKPNFPAPVEPMSPITPIVPEVTRRVFIEEKPKPKPGIRIINDHRGGVVAMFSDNVPLVPRKPEVHVTHAMEKHDEFPVFPE